MTKRDKTVEKMKRNPRDWKIDDLKAVARRFNIDWRQPGTSHVTFVAPNDPD